MFLQTQIVNQTAFIVS